MTPSADLLRKGTTKKKKTRNKINKITKATSKSKKFLRIKCPICFNNLGQEPVSSTICGHVFCTACLRKAICMRPVCPTCRRKIGGSRGHHVLYLDENAFTECELH